LTLLPTNPITPTYHRPSIEQCSIPGSLVMPSNFGARNVSLASFVAFPWAWVEGDFC